MQWGWKEDVGAQEQSEGSIQGWWAERADLPCPRLCRKLSDRWAVSPIAVNPSGDPIQVCDCTYSLARGIKGTQIVSHAL